MVFLVINYAKVEKDYILTVFAKIPTTLNIKLNVSVEQEYIFRQQTQKILLKKIT